MSSATDGPLDPFGHGLPDVGGGRLYELWMTPIKPILPTLRKTVDKPIGQLTMQEILAWGLAVGYIVATVTVAEAMLMNLARVAIRGR